MNTRGNAVRAHLRGIADAVASVVFPAPCRVCSQILSHSSRIPICNTCLESLVPYAGPACKRCGRPFVSEIVMEESEPLCHVCRRGLYDFDLARSYGLYTHQMVRAIVLLKYHKILPLGAWFAARLQQIAAQCPEMFSADLIVPVPIHDARLRERGYNQAELLARPLAKRLKLPLRPNCLVRMRPRPDKLRLTLRERWRTARGAFAIRQGTRVDKLRVLLVDDVMTTGATLDACSRALRAAGATSIVALVAARAVPQAMSAKMEPPEEPEK